MTLGSAFRAIADVIDDIAAGGLEVVDARTTDGDGSVEVEFAVAVPALDRIDDGDGVEVSIEDASVDGDGRVVFDLSANVASDPEPPVDREDAEATEGSDRGPAESSAATGGTTPTSSGGSGSVAQSEVRAAAPVTATDGEDAEPAEGDDGEGLPAHHDPEKLRAAYREHDTFADMTDALGVNVTPQTVRRQMIDHGIHEPATVGTDASDTATGPDVDGSNEADDGEPGSREGMDGGSTKSRDGPAHDREDRDRTADWIDLPAGTSLDDLKEAVRSSRTVYEVARSLGIERERTRRLLDDLDLLDLVTGRIAEDRRVTPEEVDRRVERAAPRSA